MSKEKYSEKKECKKCLHYEMCLENFREAKKEGLWELTDEEEYFSHADECDFYAAGYRKQSEGEWKKPSRYSESICTICKKSPCQYFGMLPPFCPNCGAKMKGGEE